MANHPNKLEEQSAPQVGINLVAVYQSVLDIVAHLEEKLYTRKQSIGTVLRQAEVLDHSDLPDPASDVSTSQG